MMVSDNLVNDAKKIITPDLVKMFSGEVDEPLDMTDTALKSVLPSLIMGVASKGSTAEKILNMVKDQDDKIRAGHDVVTNIFGKNPRSIIASISRSTGMNSTSITKLMELAAPMIMGIIGAKIKNQKLGANGLISLLKKQSSDVELPSLDKENRQDERKSWGKLILLFILVFGALILLTGRKINKEIVPQPVSEGPIDSNDDQSLSYRRAEAVKDELIGFGIQGNRIDTLGLGDSKKTSRIEIIVSGI